MLHAVPGFVFTKAAAFTSQSQQKYQFSQRHVPSPPPNITSLYQTELWTLLVLRSHFKSQESKAMKTLRYHRVVER